MARVAKINGQWFNKDTGKVIYEPSHINMLENYSRQLAADPQKPQRDRQEQAQEKRRAGQYRLKGLQELLKMGGDHGDEPLYDLSPERREEYQGQLDAAIMNQATGLPLFPEEQSVGGPTERVDDLLSQINSGEKYGSMPPRKSVNQIGLNAGVDNQFKNLGIGGQQEDIGFGRILEAILNRTNPVHNLAKRLKPSAENIGKKIQSEGLEGVDDLLGKINPAHRGAKYLADKIKNMSQEDLIKLAEGL